MKTRAQRVTFRATLVVFAIVSLFLACWLAFHAEDPIGMFLVILIPGILAGLIVAGLVIWVMKAFSQEPPQDSDTDQKNKTSTKLLIALFLASMMTLIFISAMIVLKGWGA